MIEIRWKCGHVAQVSDKTAAAPMCQCGERQIVAVIPKRQPRFVGTVLGPCSEYKALEPGTVNVAPSGPLKLTERSE